MNDEMIKHINEGYSKGGYILAHDKPAKFEVVPWPCKPADCLSCTSMSRYGDVQGKGFCAKNEKWVSRREGVLCDQLDFIDRGLLE